MKVIPELDDEQIRMGFVRTTVVDEKGERTGLISVGDLVQLVGRVFRWDLQHREVKLVSRFDESPFLAFGQNGGRWVAVKDIPPDEYFLTTVTGLAYRVRLPRLVAKVGNYGSSALFWTDAEVLDAQSSLYPLMIGNISDTGWVCLGSTGLKCEKPENIDKFVRQAIEAPTTGTYLTANTRVERLYEQLAKRWAPGIGRKHRTTLKRLITSDAVI